MTALADPVAVDAGDRLRTPLHVVRGAVELILSGDAGPVGGGALSLLAEIGTALDELEAEIERFLAPSATAAMPPACPSRPNDKKRRFDT